MTAIEILQMDSATVTVLQWRRVPIMRLVVPYDAFQRELDHVRLRAALVLFEDGDSRGFFATALDLDDRDASCWALAYQYAPELSDVTALAGTLISSPENVEDLEVMLIANREVVDNIDWFCDDADNLSDLLASCRARLDALPFSVVSERALLDAIAGGIDVYHGTADIARYRGRDENASICYAIEREIAERYAYRARKDGVGATGHKMIDDRATIVTARIPAGAKIADTATVTALGPEHGFDAPLDLDETTWKRLDSPATQQALRDLGYEYVIIRDGCATRYLAIRALVRAIDVAEEQI